LSKNLRLCLLYLCYASALGGETLLPGNMYRIQLPENSS
jgi:hypothetical protein